MANQIDALKREREHYLTRGLKDRADQVTAVLVALGVEDKPAKPAAPVAGIPRTASAPGPATAPSKPRKSASKRKGE